MNLFWFTSWNCFWSTESHRRALNLKMHSTFVYPRCSEKATQRESTSLDYSNAFLSSTTAWRWWPLQSLQFQQFVTYVTGLPLLYHLLETIFPECYALETAEDVQKGSAAEMATEMKAPTNFNRSNTQQKKNCNYSYQSCQLCDWELLDCSILVRSHWRLITS